MLFTRRDAGKIALAAMPLARGFAAPNSKINGVQIGVITYSFRGMSEFDAVLDAVSKLGINSIELMSNHAEAGAGAPPMPRLGPPPGAGPAADGEQRQPRPAGAPTAEQTGGFRARMNSPEMQKYREDLRAWRQSASMDKFKAVRTRFADAGIQVAQLTYNMNERTPDDEIEYAFQMAKALGVKALTTSTQVTVSKRIAPFADKHKLMVGFHGHDAVNNPNEFATLESFATAMSYSKYHGVNLDIGHFTASNYDAIAYIKEHHDRITNLHLKDRKKDHGPNTPWGQGDTPIREVLQLLKKEKYPFPANIEYEYRGESDPVTEVGKCLEFCKAALA
jgi:sugar phosphate isomerase/epimerase